MNRRHRHIARGVRLVPGLLSLAVLLLLAPQGARAQEQEAAETHVVQPGETLYRIARNHGITVEELKRLNGLTSNLIEVGQRLVIRPAPAPPPPQLDPPGPDTLVVLPDSVLASPDTVGSPAEDLPPPAPNEEAAPGTEASASDEPVRPAYGRYEVQPGDTYLTLAVRFGVSADSLWLINDRQTAPLQSGQSIRLPARFATVAYRVRRGDTLARIAQKHGTSITAIRRINDLRGDQISIDQVLDVPFGEPPIVREDASLPPVEVRGAVTIYPETFAGRLMASGAPYDPNRYTVSHPTLPLGTLVYLTHPSTKRSTLAEVTDRGPLDAAYIMDVSAAVAQYLGLDEGERVQVRVLGR